MPIAGTPRVYEPEGGDGMKKGWLWVTLAALLFLGRLNPVIAAPSDSRQLAENMVNSLYENDFSTYPVYVLKDISPTKYVWDLANQEKTRIVAFHCPVLGPTAGIIDEKLVALDKGKIFNVYSLLAAKKKYCPDYTEIKFYSWILDNGYSLHQVLLSSYDAQGYPGHGALVKSSLEDQFYWLNIADASDYKEIHASFKDNLPFDHDLYGMIRSEKVWKQLTDSKLDLSKSKMILMDRFDLLSNTWGLLFYDGSHEYYMCPVEQTYYQGLFRSKYVKDEELIQRTILPYHLYDVSEDFLPFILNQYRIAYGIV